MISLRGCAYDSAAIWDKSMLLNEIGGGKLGAESERREHLRIPRPSRLGEVLVDQLQKFFAYIRYRFKAITADDPTQITGINFVG